jgi:hypothetical protein
MTFSVEQIRLVTVILISMGLIFLGGALFYQHSTPPLHKRKPMLWAFAIALASGGGSTILGIIFDILLPKDLSNTMKKYKAEKI